MRFIPSKYVSYTMEYNENSRCFTDEVTGEVYRMRVATARQGKSLHVIGYLDGEIAYEQRWLIDATLAMRYSALGYLPNHAAAVSGAFDCMMQQLPK